MKKMTKKKPFVLSVGGWKFNVDHCYKGQEKLARHQAEIIRSALSEDSTKRAQVTSQKDKP